MLLLKNLWVSVEGKEILRGVGMEIKPGEIHAVMGPNGGGKSTLAQTLMGNPNYVIANNSNVKTNKPMVKIDGKSILKLTPDERARAGLFLAFQYPVAIAGVSVQNFLWRAHQALNPKSKLKVLQFRQELQKVAESLGMDPELLKRSLNEDFSGGEKKRVEVLQLLILKPKYVILDEIDSGLDIDAIKVVAKGIKQAMADFRPGVLLITHYQRILNYLKPDLVHVMVEGRIRETGGVELVQRLEKQGYKSKKDN